MKRDLDLVRELLLALEGAPEVNAVESLVAKGYSEEAIGFHSFLLGDAGYARVFDTSTVMDTVPQAIASSITWRGYEFLDSARESKRWTKAKGALAKVGGTSLEVALDLLKDYAKNELGL